MTTQSPEEPEPGSGSAVLVEERPEHARRRPPAVRILTAELSPAGIYVGVIFAALSLHPSLLPRAALVQGLVTGITTMIGYGLGAASAAVLRYLKVPGLPSRWRRLGLQVAVLLAAVLVVWSIAKHQGWQNDVRSLLGMPALTTQHWPIIAGVFLLTAALLLLVARLFRVLYHVTIAGLARVLPPRVAVVVGASVLTLFVWLLASGVLMNGVWWAVDGFFARANTDNKPGVTGPPTSDLRSGGPSSLVRWESLGREGRAFVSLGPTREDIQQFDPGTQAEEPIRVFAGLASANTVQERADLVLAELKRTDAFDREAILITSSTGSGFLDPGATDSFEYLLHGDTAIAGAQYSDLPSSLSLLADADNVLATTQTLFSTVYGYIRTLPEDQRPKVYVYGLSLGAYGAGSVVGSIQLMNEPVDGALLMGPPFVNPLHQRLLAERDEGSPIWRPVIDDGLTVRFTSKEPYLLQVPGPWGPTRVAYVQHGSDPIVWFSPDLAVESPEWLTPGNRAPDVSNELSWAPLIFQWQVGADVLAATDVPYGYGHNYSPTEAVYAWDAVLKLSGWSDDELNRLSERITNEVAAAESS